MKALWILTLAVAAWVLLLAAVRLLVWAQGTVWALPVAVLVCLPLLAVTFRKAPL